MLSLPTLLAALLSIAPGVFAAPVSDPQVLANTSFGPIPGQSSNYETYYGLAAPFPANYSGAIMNTTSGPPGADDRLFQNLLAAQWVIFSFYQQGVERFNQSAFVQAGFKNTTYQRIMQIRDNEAGLMRIFQNQISSNSIKPGGCQYNFKFQDAPSYLAYLAQYELLSMDYLTGLSQQAQLDSSKRLLIAAAETQSRHNTWSLIDVWNQSPFAGPIDTTYAYGNQLLEILTRNIINGSCPSVNPVFPNPTKPGIFLSHPKNTTTLAPGAHVVYNFTDPSGILHFDENTDYYSVYLHGIYNISMPYDKATNSSTIPAEFVNDGIIMALISNEIGAPTPESVVAGPGFALWELPVAETLALAT